MKPIKLLFLLVILTLCGLPALAQGSAKVVKVSTGESAYKVKRGSSVQIAIVIDIEHGYHINSNRPSDKNLIPTALKVERVGGLSASSVAYPKAKLQKFDFSPKPLWVYEGKTVLKLTVRALPSAAAGNRELKGKLTLQACNNQQCLRPQTLEVSIPVQIE